MDLLKLQFISANIAKMSPGPLEEWIFFDHPSGRTRIHDAMTWKAENLGLFGQGPSEGIAPAK